MMSSLFFILLLFMALPPSNLLSISENPAMSDDLSVSPSVSRELNPSGHSGSSLSFEWSGPRSLRVTTSDGDEDDIKLRPAPGIGDVTVDCLFTGYLVRDLGSSAGVLGCEDWFEVSITMVSNYSAATMFTLFNDNKTTVEILDMDPSDNFEANYTEEELDRPKRSMYIDQYENDYVQDDLEYAGSAMPQNLFYKFQIAYDDAILNIINSKAATEEYLTSVATLAQTYFKKASLGTNIHFIINPKMRYLEGKQFIIDPNIKDPGAKSTMKDAMAIENVEPLIIFTCTDETEAWRGVAPRRQACSDTDARALIKHRKLVQKVALDMAHELGHLFGSYDAESSWENPSCIGDGIMTGQGDPTKKPEEWSRCTKERLLKVYTRKTNKCLITAPNCDNTAWSSPCTCGVGVDTNLCTSEEEGYCQNSTATCMVKEDKVKQLLELLENKLETCSAFTHNTLLSCCADPEPLDNGRFFCLADGVTCHVVCDPGYYLEITDMAGRSALEVQRFMKCLSNTWTPLPTTFQCTLDCHYRDNAHNPACAGTCRRGATLLSTSPRLDMVLCKDKTQSTCQKDFETLCPAGWNLCTPGQFNNRNDGWDYNWKDAKAGYPLGVIYCHLGGDAALHYYISNAVFNTDKRLNCYWASSRPGCELYAGRYDCNNKGSSALCCAPSRTCGDGLVQQEEDCDDGNDSNNDDCLNSCTWKNPRKHGLSGNGC